MSDQLQIGGGKVVLRTPSGTYFNESADKARETASRYGYTIVPADEARRENERRQYKGETGQAAAETVVRTLSFGQVTGITPGESEEVRRQRAEVFQEEHPFLAGAAGAGAELAIDVGVSGLAGALTGGAAAAPTLAALRGLRGARLVKAGGSYALKALAPGAAAGAAGEANQAFVEDRPMRPYEAMAFGAMFDWGARAVPVGASKLVGKLRKAKGDTADAIRKLAGQADTPDALNAAHARAMMVEAPDVYARADSVDFADLDSVAELAKHSKEIRRTSADGIARELRAQADTIGEVTSRRAKRAKLAVPDNMTPQVEAVVDSLAASEERLAAVRAAASGTEAERFVETFARRIDEHAGAALDATSGAERFHALDDMKRFAQETHVNIGRAIAGSPEGQLKYGELSQAVRDFSQVARETLEREDLWGAAAQYQKAINAELSAGAGARSYIEAKLGKNVGSDFFGRKQVAFDADSVKTLLGKDQDASVLREQFDAYVKSQARQVDVLERFGMLDSAGAERARKSLGQIDTSHVKARNAAKAADEWATRKEASALSAERGGGGVVRALAGYAASHVPIAGPALGKAVSLLGDTAAVAGRLVDAAAAAAVGRRTLGNQAAFSAAGRFAHHLADPPIVAFSDGYETPEEAFEAHSGLIRAALQDPASWADALARDSSWLVQVDPQLHAEVMQRQWRALQFLAQNLPAQVGVSMLSPTGFPPSRHAIAEFARLYLAVTRPETVLLELAAGVASPKQIDAVRQVHPDMYEDLLSAVLDQVQNSPEALPPNRKVALTTLFRLGGAAGFAYSPNAALMFSGERGASTQDAPSRVSERTLQKMSEARAPALQRTLSEGVTNG